MVKIKGISRRDSERVEKLTYTVEECARAIGIGRTSVYELIATGELLTVKIGGRRLVPVSAARALLESAIAVEEITRKQK
jgi:excisionase family DNA binding protein